MKRISALSALLLLCACGEEFTGLGSVDLQITSITFHDSDPATITGNLLSGKPAGFIMKADGTLISSMTVTCSSPADTQGMAEANNEVDFPLFYTVSDNEETDSSISFEIDCGGLSWSPDYSFIQENSQNRVYASAKLMNMTVQTWQADTLRFNDNENQSVTTATGRITVRQGESLIPWWDAPTGNPVHVIRYGWPQSGRWNPLTAVYCPAGGRVESWTNQVWLSGDTLYFPADSLIELELTWEQHPGEYQCFLTAESRAESMIEWEIQWPDRLPRGAEIEPGQETLQIAPRESITILYKEVY